MSHLGRPRYCSDRPSPFQPTCKVGSQQLTALCFAVGVMHLSASATLRPPRGYSVPREAQSFRTLYSWGLRCSIESGHLLLSELVRLDDGCIDAEVSCSKTQRPVVLTPDCVGPHQSTVNLLLLRCMVVVGIHVRGCRLHCFDAELHVQL